ncbi:hypothetical protein AN964_14075 [Heyndrickxia shackletonii]|uniref:Phage head-tail adaptor n=1 Tax=Heyndrickxia shackletonii TaxID=157838 RepID=A0A0Q3TLG1_9BACI|nr:phage head closure protein [Heyndrickxia shackletonii]KQL54513.1 hypothetical protein AN964_14075 [Heyndrickxia shackletonii]NEY99245.1 phage head closure protein [Heyndrickxia shackletonii]
MTRFRINPGEYRHIITFQKKIDVQNSYGENIKDWVDIEGLIKLRAGIYPISGKEFFAAGAVNSEVTHKVNMRYMPNKEITPDMRIKYFDNVMEKDRYFELIAPPINFQEKNVEIQLLCKEVI